MSMIDVVFMGSEQFSLPILRSLTPVQDDARTRVVGIVTQPDRPAGRGRNVVGNPVKVFARARGIPVLQPERLREEGSVAAVLELRPELIIVASYGQIVPRALLDAPRFKSLNLHPSLLPRYRGASPVTAPILAGDAESGTTLMLMVPKMDAGPILAQERTLIGPAETAGELEARLADLSAGLLANQLENWVRERIRPVEQDERQATYTTRIDKADGIIDWRASAELIVRQIRAFNPWPTAYTYWDGRMIKILRAHVSPGEGTPGRVGDRPGEPLRVATGQGMVRVDELQIAGGKPLTAEQFLRGRPSLVGQVLGGPS